MGKGTRVERVERRERKKKCNRREKLELTPIIRKENLIVLCVCMLCLCLLACCGGGSFQCVRVHLYDFIGVPEQLSFLNECNYVINN